MTPLKKKREIKVWCFKNKARGFLSEKTKRLSGASTHVEA